MKNPPEDPDSLKIIGDVHRLIAPFTDPVLGELGKYVSEKIRFVRFRNSLKTMEKAKQLLDEHGLNPNPVELKVLIPILEHSSLEDEQSMVEKWARLLASASSKAFVPPLFPKILAELTPQEVRFLDWMWSQTIMSECQDPDKNRISVEKARASGCLAEREFDLFVRNLLRLGLILVGGVATVHDNLKPRELQDYQITMLSSLGRHFVRACRGPHDEFL